MSIRACGPQSLAEGRGSMRPLRRTLPSYGFHPEARRSHPGRRSHTKNYPQRRTASCGHTGRFSATPGKGALPIGSIQLFSFFQKTKRNGGGPDPRPRRLYVAWGPACRFVLHIAFIRQHPAGVHESRPFFHPASYDATLFLVRVQEKKTHEVSENLQYRIGASGACGAAPARRPWSASPARSR